MDRVHVETSGGVQPWEILHNQKVPTVQAHVGDSCGYACGRNSMTALHSKMWTSKECKQNYAPSFPA